MANNRQLAIILKLQDEASRELRKFQNTLGNTENSTRSWGVSLASVAKQLAIVGTAAAGFLGYGVKIAADLETAEIGLHTLLGSAEEAAATVARLKVEAARTPFELPGLTQATQLLSSVTKDGNKSIDILLNVGEALAAMGKGQAELDRIIINLQQVAAVGKASMVDIKQFAFAGIPIFEMLEDHFKSGVTSITDNSEAITKNGAQLAKLQQQLAVARARQADFTEATSDATRMSTRFKIDELTGKIAALSGSLSTLKATNGQAVTSIISVEDAIANGEVTFELLTQLFDQANDAGGRFFNAYKNQSGTFNQSLSNLKDSFGIFLADIVTGTGIFDGLIQAMQTASSILTNYETIIGTAADQTRTFLQFLDQKTGLVTTFKDAWANVVFVFNDQLKPALVELWATLQPFKPFLDAMVQVLGIALIGAIGTLIIIVGGLAAGFIQLLTWTTKLANFVADYLIDQWNIFTDVLAYVIELVEKVIEKFKQAIDLAGTVAKFVGGKVFGGGKKSESVNDAIISPDGRIITTHPDDYLIATKNPASLAGGGITVNITGNTLLDAFAAEKMGDLIIRQLKRSSAI